VEGKGLKFLGGGEVTSPRASIKGCKYDPPGRIALLLLEGTGGERGLIFGGNSASEGVKLIMRRGKGASWDGGDFLPARKNASVIVPDVGNGGVWLGAFRIRVMNWAGEGKRVIDDGLGPVS